MVDQASTLTSNKIYQSLHIVVKMDRRWSIGSTMIPRSKTEYQITGSFNNVPNPCMTINLTKMLSANKKEEERKLIPIRPPTPRVSQPKAQALQRCEPIPRPIIQRRSKSLPSPLERKKRFANVGVRFADSLGLDLEDVKLFKTGEDPLIPQHVIFRLLMGAELADGGHLEISLPYLKPVFSQQPGDQPEFLNCLNQQKVCLERVLCFELGIIGITQVVNLGFDKEVSVRYSFTEWKSSIETKASWVTTITKPLDVGDQLSIDTFRFHLPVPPFLLPGAVLEFAIRYNVCGAEYWDNSNGQNYKLVCHNYKLTVPKECEDSMVHFI